MAAPVVSSNSPSAGFISWTATRIVFAGNSYPIPAGSTNKRFTYWRLTGSTPGVYTQATDTLAGGTSNVISTDVLPDSTAFDGLTDTMLFLNKSGVAVLAPSATTVDGSLIVSGSILTDAIGANQIVSTHIAANEVKTVNLATDSVLAGKIKAGEINTNHLSSGVVTASKLSIGSFTDNLAPNPYFEDWPVANPMPERWNLSTATGYTGATVTRETASGSVVAGTVTLGLTAAAGLQAAIFSDAVPVVAGRDIYLGVYYAGTGAALAGGLLVGFYFFDSTGALITSQSTNEDITGGNTLQQAQYVGVAPAGAVTMQPLIVTSSTTKVLLDNVEMAYRMQGVMIQDGAISATQINSNAVTADKLEATLVLTTDLTTRSLNANGDPSGSGLDILGGPSGGLYTYDANGTARVEMPVDPTLPDTFRGNAEVDNLTVNVGATLPATSLAQSAVFSLQTSVQAPWAAAYGDDYLLHH
jgi:hypothetical protein